MPTGAFASHYWPGDGEGPQPPGPSEGGQVYPYWFDPSVVGFLGLAGWRLPLPRKRFWWEKYHKKVKGFLIHLYRRLPVRLKVLGMLLPLVFSSEFTLAVGVVQSVARDPSTRKLKYWADIDRQTVSNAVVGENVFRSLAATSRLTPLTSQLTRQQREVLIELAWMGVKK